MPVVWDLKRSMCCSLRSSTLKWDRNKVVDTRRPTTYTRCHCILGGWGGLFCHQFSKLLKIAWNGYIWCQNIFPHLEGGFSATKTKVANEDCLKWIHLVSKIFPSSWRGLLCHQNQSCSKVPEMDRSGAPWEFPLIGGGGLFCHQEPKLLEIAWNGHRSGVKKFSLHFGGELFCHQNQSCLKLPEMDRSGVKKCSLICGGGGLFCHQNQSCSKLPEMDRSGVKKFSLICGGGRGGGSATKTKVAWNCLKWIDLVSKEFSLILGGGGAFLPPKPKLLEITWNGYIWCQKNFPSSGWGGGGGVLPPKPKLLKIAWNGYIWCQKNFPCIWWGGGFSAKSPPMWDSMMHEISVHEVTSHHRIRAEYLTKRQKNEIGGGFIQECRFARLELLPVEYSSLLFYTKD